MAGSDEVVERIRAATDIVEVVGKRIPLKRQGRRFVGLCPFHNDKNPSLTVSSEKQFYKCFSCNAGGDVFTFLMEYEHKTFPEVLAELAKACGVALPRRGSWSEGGGIDPNLKSKAVNEWAKTLYHRYLLGHKNASQGRDYIRSRGLSKEMVTGFELGYAPDDWGFIAPRLLNKFPREEVVRSGLVGVKKSNGECYDTFRGRIVFPIRNEKREVVGFGGRAISPSENAKYLNTKETPFFQKRHVLYGLAGAYSQLVREGTAFVVEGYLDVIACQSVGIAAVAPLGTALTSQHLAKLSRYVNRLVLVFDGDEAGLRASLASCAQLLSKGLVGHVSMLPTGSDPYDSLQKNGKEGFLSIVEANKIDCESFLIEGALSEVLGEQPTTIQGKQALWKAAASLPGNEKRNVVERLKELVLPVSDPIVRKAFFEKVATTFKVGLQDLGASFAAVPRSSRRQGLPSNPVQAQRERRLVLFLCAHPKFITNAFTIIRPESLVDPFSKWVYEKLISLKNKNISLSGVLESIGDQKIVGYIETQLMKQEALGASSSATDTKNNNDNLFADYLYAVRKGQLDQATRVISKAIHQHTIDGNEQKLQEAIEEKIRLVTERNNLQNYHHKV